MKKELLFLLAGLAVFLIISCKKDNRPAEDKFSLESYRNSDNALENLTYCFSKAKAIIGDDAALFLISGEQKNDVAGINFDLDFYWYFISGTRVLEFDISQKIIRELQTEVALGQEYIYEHDDRLNSLISPKDLWDKCIEDHSKNLLNFSFYVPLGYPPAGFNYYFSTKAGMAYFGIDCFIYNARTGDDITHN